LRFMKQAQCKALLLVCSAEFFISARQPETKPYAVPLGNDICFLTFSTLCVSSTARSALDLAGLCASVPPLAQSRSSQSPFKSSRLFHFAANSQFHTTLAVTPEPDLPDLARDPLRRNTTPHLRIERDALSTLGHISRPLAVSLLVRSW
jgi:hypothetical protein